MPGIQRERILESINTIAEKKGPDVSRLPSYHFSKACRVAMAGTVAATLFGLLPVALTADEPTARLDIEINDIDELRGQIVIAVFDSAGAFDARTDPVAQARLPAATGAVYWAAELEIAGDYAVIVYQDLNENGAIDMGRFGRPREPYGFSNNVRGTFGPPGFDEARFEMAPEGLSIVIEVD